jgi:hypothetical protein
MAHAGATAWSERHVLAIPAWHPAEWLSVLHCTQAQNHSAADEREPLDLRSNSAAVRQRKPSLGDAARLYLDAKSTQIRPQAQSSTPRSLFASIRVLDQFDVRPIAGTEGGLNPFFSPDGRSLGFSTFLELKRVPTAGGPATTICAIDAYFSGASWGAMFTQSSLGLLQVPASGGKPVTIAQPDQVKVFGRRLRIRLKRSTLTDAVAFRPHPTSML